MRSHAGWVIALFGFVLYALSMPALYQQPRMQASGEMEVVLPRFVQVLMLAGDRYLAANVAAFRALVVSTETMTAENYKILGLVQSDVSWLNPAHEDNYYIATAILPWNEQVPASQYILRRASDARPFDWLPPFYYAFNELHFNKNPVQASEWMRIAATHTQDEMEILGLQQTAALWIAKGEDLNLAIEITRAMAEATKYEAFAKFLEKRAQRLENLLSLQKAIASYQQLTGEVPETLDALVKAGVIAALPVDPFGQNYSLDEHGKPQMEKKSSRQ